MSNGAQLSVVGYVASDPEIRTVGAAMVPRLTLRVAWSDRRKNAETGEWYDANSSFANVTCWRQLAINASTCVRKGDAIQLRGWLNVREYISKEGQRGTSVDIEAETLGPNLSRGVASFSKVLPNSGKTAAELAAEAARVLAASGPDGIPGGDVAGLAGAGDGAVTGEGAVTRDGALTGDGAPVVEMFDDSAIEALAQETEEASVPF